VSGSVLSGAGVMLASRLAVAVLGWIGTILIARGLSEGSWGAYSLIFNIVGIIGLLADLQISRVVMVEMLDVGYVIAVGFVVIAGYSQEVVVGTMVAGLNFFLASTLWALVTVCQIRLWLRPVAIALVLGQIVQLALTIVLYVTEQGTVVRYAIPVVLYDLVAVVFVVIAMRPYVSVRPRIDLHRWWVWTKAAVPLALGSSLATIYFRIDSVMLSKLDDDGLAAVGRYQYGYKFSDILAFVASALLGVVLPLLVRSWPNNIPNFRKVFRQAFLLLIIAGAAAAVSFAVVAQEAITNLFDAPASAAVPARVLVVGQALNFFTQLWAITLIASAKHRIYPYATLAGLIVNVGLNFVLIPHFSATGAGIATVLTELVVLGVMGVVVMQIPGVRPLPWRGIVVVAIGAAVLAGAIGVLMQVFWWPIALVLGLPAYLAVLHLLRIDGPGGLHKLVRDSRIDLTPPPASATTP
jgi:O-antigen/teichoic acid export membrane protein